MNGVFFLLATNIAIALVMAVAFFSIAYFDRANRPARWFGLAFVFAVLGFSGEYVLATGQFEDTAHMVAAVSFLVTFVLIAHALALRYRVELGWPASLAIVAASTLLHALILDLPRADFTRQMLYQLPYALVSLLCAWVILRAANKRIVDWAGVALLVLLAAHFAAKPYIAQWTGGVGDAPGDYTTTLYAAISQSSGGILLLILAMLALALVTLDSASTLIGRSERDRETGFLNQHGFENHARRLLREPANSGKTDTTLTLIAVVGPGTHGDIEDIARAIATVLINHTAPRTLTGRMAPLEFAIWEPGANLFAARRSAEAIRVALAGALVDNDGGGPTVSIGITEREDADSWADMLARSLWALEEARRAGGNCVRLAARSGVGLSRLG